MSILRRTLSEMRVLLEDRKDGLVKRFTPEITKRWGAIIHPQLDQLQVPEPFRNDQTRIAQHVIERIMAADPDPQKRFSTWMVQTFVRGQLLIEDLPRLHDALALYRQAKAANQIPRDHDLGRIKKLDDLYTLVGKFKSSDGPKQEIVDQTFVRQMDAESQVVMDTPRYEIRIPKTPLAMQWFGRNTEWCTAWGSKFGRHPTRTQQKYSGNLYIITDKQTGDLWQFHRETGQFMDVNDRAVPRDQYVNAHPEVAKFFVDQDVTSRTKIAEFSYGGEAIGVFDSGSQISFGGGSGLNASPNLGYLDYSAQKRIITKSYFQYEFHKAMRNDLELSNKIIEILNTAKVIGRANDLKQNGIFWNKRWGRLSEVGQRLANASGMSAYMIENKVEKTYYIIEDDHYNWSLEFTVLDRVRSVYLCEQNSIRLYEIPPITSFGTVIHAMLKKINDPKFTVLRNDGSFDFFDDEEAKEIGKKFPGIVPLHVDYAIHGDTPRFRERLEDKFEYEFQSGWTPEWIGDSIKLIEYPDLDDVLEDVGNDSAQWCLKVIEGHEHPDWGGSDGASDDNKKDLLDGLKEPERLALAKWMREQYPDEIKRFEEEEDDKFEGNVDQILLLIEAYLDDDPLDDAFDNAVRTGMESGSEAEMANAFWAAVNGSNIHTKKGQKYEPGYEHDAPNYAFFVPLKSIMSAMGRYSDEEFKISDVKEELGIEIEVTEPYYGWSDYDEDVAQERFEEALAELIG